MKKKGGLGKEERKRKEDCGWWNEAENVCSIDDLLCVLDDGVTEDCEEFETKEEIERRVRKRMKKETEG
jgi:hypothetical protein